MSHWRFGFVLAILAILGAAPAMADTGFLDRTVTVEKVTYRYQVYVPSNHRPGMPIILFLHGAGKRGSDNLTQTEEGMGPAIRTNPEQYPAIVVFPQAPAGGNWQGVAARYALAALDAATKEFKPDPKRVYLTGNSLGGNGTWYIAYNNPDRFAAVAPVCGWADAMGNGASFVPASEGDAPTAVAKRLGKTPIFIAHGDSDKLVSVEQSRKMAAALKAAGANYNYIELPGVGHNAWDPTYRSAVFTSWLFSQRKP